YLPSLTSADLAGGVAAPPIQSIHRQCRRVCFSRRDEARSLESENRARGETVGRVAETELPLTVPPPCVNPPADAERQRKVHARRNALRALGQIDMAWDRRVRG